MKTTSKNWKCAACTFAQFLNLRLYCMYYKEWLKNGNPKCEYFESKESE